MPKTVYSRERVWNDAAGEHKMGWVNPDDVLSVKELYIKDDVEWARFEIVMGGKELVPFGAGYNEYWVPVSALLPIPEIPDALFELDDDPSDVPTNEEIGKVIRYLFRFQ